jgi:hypothetical protein
VTLPVVGVILVVVGLVRLNAQTRAVGAEDGGNGATAVIDCSSVFQAWSRTRDNTDSAGPTIAPATGFPVDQGGGPDYAGCDTNRYNNAVAGITVLSLGLLALVAVGSVEALEARRQLLRRRSGG